MSTTPESPIGLPMREADRSRRPITVLAQPGGRFPGVELPPVWFQSPRSGPLIASRMPAKEDHAAVMDAVRQMCLAIREAARAAFDAGEHPVLIGGDHSMAMGTIAAAASRHERMAVIWVDAHGDFNTLETSPSGNPHGMPLAVSCGLGDSRLTSLFTHFVNPRDVVLVAARDVDPGEQELLDRHGVWCVSVEELRARGVAWLAGAIAARFQGLPVHLSFDFDALSSEYFSATGTPVAQGLAPEEAEAFLRALAAGPLEIGSSDWVEFDPRHETAKEAAQLAWRVYSAFHGPRA